MNWKHSCPAIALATVLAACTHQGHPATQTESADVATTPRELDREAAEYWRDIEPENVLILELEWGSVLVELAPQFAPKHVAQMRRLVRTGHYDQRATFYRVIDNFVAQAGVRNDSPPSEEERSAAQRLSAEFERPLGDLAFVPHGSADLYAPETGHIDGFAVGHDPEAGTVWPLHCYGTVAMARGTDPDTGSSHFYIVIGRDQRYLDRNLTVFGRVIAGMDNIQRVSRGDRAVDSGVIPDAADRTLIRRMTIAADLPPVDRPRLQTMRSDTPAFAAEKDGKYYRDSDFFVSKPTIVEACAVPVPVRTAPGEPEIARDRTDGTVQYPDESFTVPDGGEPRHPDGQGPIIGIDEAHRNYHTAEGRYRSFANLLSQDGYRVRRHTETFRPEALIGLDVLVISNALSAAKENDWSLPTPPAFTADEVATVESWVRDGGRLMLIADHMPFPGAAANLAKAFGVVFYDSYAYRPESFDNRESQLVFSKEQRLLANNAVTRREGGGEVPFVVTFTGQGFRVLSGVRAEPLLRLADDSFLLLPTRAYAFDENAPRVPGIGLLQGVLIEHGAGRVAVFGEAAAFSAQIQERPAGPYPFGMNNPAAPHNARFLLNVMNWLSADVGDAE